MFKDDTQLRIFIAYLAIKAGITPKQMAKVYMPAGKEIEKCVEFLNKMLEIKKNGQINKKTKSVRR